MTQKTNLDPKEWRKLFPAKVECYSSSLKFMKQLTTIAVSTITYLKCMFPDINYMTVNFNETGLKILKYKCETMEAQFIVKSLLNAFDALEKKYLHKMALCFYKDGNGPHNNFNLIETFWFQFNYIDNEVSMHTKSPNSQGNKESITFNNIQLSTINMIRSCIVVSHCSQELPKNFDLVIMLHYNDDAPGDYQAPGYTLREYDNMVELANKISLGVVKTRFHELVSWTCYNDQAIVSDTTPQGTQGTQHNSKTVDERAKGVLKCPCDNYNDPQWPSLEMLRCTFCNTLQHAVCFGVVSNIQRHCCCVCADEDKSRLPTDNKLAVYVTAKLRKSLCMYRRTLWWCLTSSKSHISGSELAKHFSIGRADAVIILQQMQKHNVIDARINDGISQPRRVLIEGLRTVMEEYFQNVSMKYSDKTLKVMSDCTSTSTGDPTAKIVKSFEEVSLSEPSSVQHNDARVDGVRKRLFREAITKSDTIPEGMPLNGPHNAVPDLDKIVREKKSLKRKTAVKGNEKCGDNSKKMKNATQ